MSFCPYCGKEMAEGTAFCVNCGQPVAAPVPVQPQYQPQPQYQAPVQPQQPSTLATVAKVLMIISTVVMGLYLLPLAWCLPMTLNYCKKIKSGEPVTTGFKVCTLLFVNTIAGILMLCDKDN